MKAMHEDCRLDKYFCAENLSCYQQHHYCSGLDSTIFIDIYIEVQSSYLCQDGCGTQLSCLSLTLEVVEFDILLFPGIQVREPWQDYRATDSLVGGLKFGKVIAVQTVKGEVLYLKRCSEAPFSIGTVDLKGHCLSCPQVRECSHCFDHADFGMYGCFPNQYGTEPPGCEFFSREAVSGKDETGASHLKGFSALLRLSSHSHSFFRKEASHVEFLVTRAKKAQLPDLPDLRWC